MNEPRPATDLGASAREQVDRGELLVDAHRVIGAQHRDAAGETDTLGDGCGGSEHDRGRRDREVLAMVLTDGEHVEAESVGEGDLGDQIAQPDIRRRPARPSRAAA
jgi:hypothetical protein